MFNAGTEVFLLLPTQTKERILQPGIVTDRTAEGFVAELQSAQPPEIGATLLAHCEVNRKFMQQGATVTAVLASEPRPVVAFTLTGEAISADSRASFRVSLAAANLPATIDKDTNCQLLDVSATGFGVFSRSALQPGQTVTATIAYGGQSFSGAARVQSIRETAPGTYRYGLHAIEAKPGAAKNPLQKGLVQISAQVQRDQLRRRAGA